MMNSRIVGAAAGRLRVAAATGSRFGFHKLPCRLPPARGVVKLSAAYRLGHPTLGKSALVQEDRQHLQPPAAPSAITIGNLPFAIPGCATDSSRDIGQPAGAQLPTPIPAVQPVPTPSALEYSAGDEFWRKVPVWEKVSARDFLSYRWSVRRSEYPPLSLSRQISRLLWYTTIEK